MYNPTHDQGRQRYELRKKISLPLVLENSTTWLYDYVGTALSPIWVSTFVLPTCLTHWEINFVIAPSGEWLSPTGGDKKIKTSMGDNQWGR